MSDLKVMRVNGKPSPDSTIRIVLMIGMALSLLAMAAGLGLALGGSEHLGHHIPIKSLPHGLLEGDPTAVLEIGILLLIVTPIAGVAAAFISFLGKRNRDAVIAFLNLVTLVASFALAQR